MKCKRCSGPMVKEKFLSEEGMFIGWECIYCGEIVDKIILENRGVNVRRGKASTDECYREAMATTTSPEGVTEDRWERSRKRRWKDDPLLW